MAEENKFIEKPKRTKEEIQKDYAQHCAQAGENEYRIKVLESNQAAIYQKINELNAEAEALAKESQDGQTKSN